MSLSRSVRPWVPSLIFVALVLGLVLLINYSAGSFKAKTTRHQKHRKPTALKSNDINNPAFSSNSAWKDAIPWDINPRRYLPNYFTYARMINATEKLLYRRGNIVYIHVPKSGGTTMGKCFGVAIKKLKRYSQFYGPIGENGIDTVMANHKSGNSTKAAIFSGEYAFGLCERLGDQRPCSYFLVLREPYSRIVSSYMFCQRHSNDESNYFCALNVNNMTIIEWALIQRSFFFRQLLMNDDLCKGVYDDQYDFEDIIEIPKGVVKDKMPCWMKLHALINSTMTKEETVTAVNYLADSLEQWFAGVGILEEMDETLDALNIIYGLPVHPACTKLHANKAPSKNNKTSDKLKEQYIRQLKADPKVRSALFEDSLLYSRVKKIAKAQRAERKYVLMGE